MTGTKGWLKMDPVSGSTPHFVKSESSLNALKVYTVRSKITSPQQT